VAVWCRLALVRLYLGDVTYGKSRWRKAHATGTRRPKRVSQAEWITRTVPELAIIGRDLFDRVRDLKAKRLTHARRTRMPRTKKLLAGFLECGAGGGGFGEVKHRDWLQCSWRRDRGDRVCQSTLRVPTAAAEARVLHAIREQILTPENVEYAAERALAEIAKSRAASDPAAIRKEFDAFMVERNALIDAHIKGLTDPAESEPRLKAQLERKHELERRLATAETETTPFDPVALRPVIETALLEIHTALAGDDTARRDALRALLGPDRLRVYPDAEKGFRLEGALRVRLEPSARAGAERRAKQVAGGRSVRLPTQGITHLQPEWAWAA